ncbi:hypothetical protein ACF1BQ_035980 [Bradyrhizobium sp. RDT10]
MTTTDNQRGTTAALNEQRMQTKTQIEDILRDIVSKECPLVSQEDIASFDSRKRENEFPIPIQQLLEAWLRFSKSWRYSYYTLTFGIILFGALATVLTDGDLWYHKWKTGAALLATLFGGLNTTLGPSLQHRKFDEAFVVLNAAKHAYITNPYVSLCEVGKAVAYGETIIHRGE